MKAYDLVELAARNLRESLLRTSLTTLGIAVGVASLVVTLSLGIGLQENVSNRFTRSGLFNNIAVYSRREFRGPGRLEHQAQKETAESRALDENARAEMARLPNVIEVYPEIRLFTEVRYADRSRFTSVAALPPSARENDTFDGMQGQFFSGPQAEEAIVQMELARELSEKPETLLGQEIALQYAARRSLEDPRVSAAEETDAAAGTLPFGFSVVRREKKLRIVGIIETEPFGGMGGVARARMFIPVALAEQLNPAQASDLRELTRSSSGGTGYQSLVVRVGSATQVPAVQDAIKKMGFSTFSLLDASRNFRRFFAVLDLFLGLFGSTALAVASLGVINTLVMAILERRREIGIMKALGASDRDVKRLFFAEAGTMGFVGGGFGVALGWAIGRAINFGANIYLQRQELPPEKIWSVPWWLVASAIAFSILVSLLSGMYPAARAAKLDPVQALRYE